MQEATTLRLQAVLENVPEAIDFVSEAARSAGFEGQALYEIQIAVDEACANIVCHAYDGMKAGDMEILCRQQASLFLICLRDWGRSFDPDDVQDPDLEAPLEERTLGGLGLFLMRQSVDEVQFRSAPNSGNELVLTKKLPLAH